MIKTNNLKITAITPIIAPADLRQVFPLSAVHAEFVNKSRQCLKEILQRRDRRLMVVVGPCSIHDTDAAVDYARRRGWAGRPRPTGRRSAHAGHAGLL